MIEIKNVSKSFGDKEILDDVSAVMETGKTNLIIGTSGSGKTVLQKCMVGLFEVDEGEIIFDGKRFNHYAGRRKERIAAANRDAFPGLCSF